MFFIFSKILTFFISPIIWILALLLYAVFSKNQTKKRRCLIFALVFFLFLSNLVFVNEAFQLWEVPAIKNENLEKYDIGIVLGGMISYDKSLDRMQFHSGVDRLLQAIDLYKKSYIKKILFTGGSGSIKYLDNKEGIWIKKYLITIGIPEEDILIESESRNTHENALFTKRLLDSNKINGKYLLITSAFHMRRSVACFKKVGLMVKPYSTDRFSGPMKFELDFLFLPKIEAISDWELLIHEMTGYFIYKIAGYL